jgi:ureidoglycolate lyase
LPEYHNIHLQRLSPGNFRPFGEVIGQFDEAPAYSASLLRGWRFGYAADGPTDLLFIHYDHGPFECDSIERHFEVTQTFIPLADAASIMMVAAPTDRDRIPRCVDIRAFYVPGSSGIMLWRGTWHALTRFPVRLSGAGFAFLTSTETQRELERAQIDGIPPRLTEVVNLAERYGQRLRIVDPDGLIPADKRRQ